MAQAQQAGGGRPRQCGMGHRYHLGRTAPARPSAGLAATGRPIGPGWWRSVMQSIRRHGYARAALEALLQRAAREPQVRTVRVTIGPDNVASTSWRRSTDSPTSVSSGTTRTAWRSSTRSMPSICRPDHRPHMHAMSAHRTCGTTQNRALCTGRSVRQRRCRRVKSRRSVRSQSEPSLALRYDRWTRQPREIRRYARQPGCRGCHPVSC